MGQRGRNRDGYYIALLHVLELQYEREHELKGPDPHDWQPSPHNRPDQFLRWVLDVLKNLNFPPPRTLQELVGQLERGGLMRVARLLEYTVLSHASEDRRIDANLPLPVVLHEIDRPTRSLERHPQVRKFSKVVVQQLDSQWRVAVEHTAKEFGAIPGLPKAALLLGALPPSFAVLNDFIFARLADCELVAQHRTLTVLQFYGLVTGTLPAAPAAWRRAIDEVAEVGEEDLYLLATLSDSQVRQLRSLSKEAWCLLRARLRLHLTASQWRGLRESLIHSPRTVTQSTLQRLTSLLARPAEVPLGADDIRKLAQSFDWRVVEQFDEELVRLMARGELGSRLILRLQRWDEATWRAVHDLLVYDRDACLAFLEDRRILQELYESRTGAHLHLRDLFPRTTAWLDDYLSAILEDALLNDVGELETAAAIVSRRVQEKFWAEVKHEGVFRSARLRREWPHVAMANLNGVD